MARKRSPYTIAPDGLRLVKEYLGLPFTSSTSDTEREPNVVFVSIDFENGSGLVDSGPDVPLQLGIATLDTQEFCSAVHPKDIISTFNFATGPSRYLASVNIKFLFGETTQMSSSDIVPKIESHIPGTRPTILVGHGMAIELRVLQHLHFKLPKSVIGIIDTQAITSQVFSSGHHWSLRHVLQEFQCPFDNLHSAGNDAHFTLRCLLLLVSRSVTTTNTVKLMTTHEQRLKKLEEIGHSEIPKKKERPPAPPAPLTTAAKKRLKRFQRRRKHLAKSWDLEKQESIRAERALKRAKAEQTCIMS